MASYRRHHGFGKQSAWVKQDVWFPWAACLADVGGIQGQMSSGRAVCCLPGERRCVEPGIQLHVVMQAPRAIWESASLCSAQTLFSYSSLRASSGMPKGKTSMGHLIPTGGKPRKVICLFIYFSVVREHVGPKAGWLLEPTPSFLSFGPQLLDEVLQMIIVGIWEGKKKLKWHHFLLSGLKPSL